VINWLICFDVEEKSKGETVEEVIGDMISLSSVSNLDAFEHIRYIIKSGGRKDSAAVC
jgi:hypothetical protein